MHLVYYLVNLVVKQNTLTQRTQRALLKIEMSNRHHYTNFIKSTATQLGFSFCGISKAEFLKDEAPRLEEWLKKGHQGKMSYLENHFDKRLDPTLLVPGAKSVVSLLYNYYPRQDINEGSDLKIAKYAFGEDYHFVIKEKLRNSCT